MKKNITIPFPMFFALLFLLMVNLAITLVPKIVSAANVQDLLVHFDQSGGDSWINTGGNVGIGTTMPTSQLDVSGKMRIGENQASGNSNAAILEFLDRGSENYWQMAMRASDNQNVGIRDDFIIAYNRQGAWNNAMRIDADSMNIVIGDTAASYKLTVKGGVCLGNC